MSLITKIIRTIIEIVIIVGIVYYYKLDLYKIILIYIILLILIEFILFQYKKKPVFNKVDKTSEIDALYNYLDNYLDSLSLSYSQSIYYDKHRTLIVDDWRKELECFWDTKVESGTFPEFDFVSENEVWSLMYDYVTEKVSVDNNSLSINDGYEYERYCQSELSKFGYDSYVTKSSGDYGADIIAEINDKRIAIQCKYYTGQISNASVQQVNSARQHYNTEYAVVIGSSNFTKPARKLAKTNDVLLIHHTQIKNLIKYLDI